MVTSPSSPEPQSASLLTFDSLAYNAFVYMLVETIGRGSNGHQGVTPEGRTHSPALRQFLAGRAVAGDICTFGLGVGTATIRLVGRPLRKGHVVYGIVSSEQEYGFAYPEDARLLAQLAAESGKRQNQRQLWEAMYPWATEKYSPFFGPINVGGHVETVIRTTNRISSGAGGRMIGKKTDPRDDITVYFWNTKKIGKLPTTILPASHR